MNHLFGRKKQPEPAEEAPDLNAAVGRMDERVAKLDEKIKKCDEELYDYKKKVRCGGWAGDGVKEGEGGESGRDPRVVLPRPADAIGARLGQGIVQAACNASA